MSNEKKYYVKKFGRAKKPEGKVSGISREELFDRIYQIQIVNVDEILFWNPPGHGQTGVLSGAEMLELWRGFEHWKAKRRISN